MGSSRRRHDPCLPHAKRLCAASFWNLSAVFAAKTRLIGGRFAVPSIAPGFFTRLGPPVPF